MDTPLTWTLSGCNPHRICNWLLLYSSSIFSTHCISFVYRVLEEYHNKTMSLEEINLIFMQMFLLFYSSNMAAVNTPYILNSQIERNYMYWLLCFLHINNITFFFESYVSYSYKFGKQQKYIVLKRIFGE